VDRHLGWSGDRLEEPAREFVQVRLGDVSVERRAVGPLLDGDIAQRILDRLEEPVPQAALLATRLVLHRLEEPDQLDAFRGLAADPADYQQHGGEPMQSSSSGRISTAAAEGHDDREREPVHGPPMHTAPIGASGVGLEVCFGPRVRSAATGGRSG
jgi:hypothetical protein